MWNWTATYNPDEKALIIEIKPHDEMYYNLFVKTIKRNYSSYLAQNTFGAKIRVNKWDEDRFVLVITNGADFGLLNIKLQLQPQKAKALMDKIGVLILCKLSPKENGLIFKEKIYREATFSDPDEIIIHYKYLNVEAIAVWVYDTHSGEIIYKQNIKSELTKF